MKIDLNSIDTTNFVLRPVTIAGEECTLVFPQHIGCEWSKHNLHFRSSIWNNGGELISAGFPKFGNYGEKPGVFGLPKTISGSTIMEKLDGTCLIVSKYKGELIVRTRGTADASIMENGHELEILKLKYPEAFRLVNDDLEDIQTGTHSLIYEWLSPENRIVIKHDKPDIRLIGMINHEDYSLVPQCELDGIAEMISVARPKKYNFSELNNMLETVKLFKGTEGVCMYSADGQHIHKIKADDYLIKHRLKDELCNIERVIDFYFSHDCPSYNEFYVAVENEIDWETAEEIKGDMFRIVDGMKNVDMLINHMAGFIEPLKMISRKEAAEKILQEYNNNSGFAFKLLDGKELDNDAKKKLLSQVLKK